MIDGATVVERPRAGPDGAGLEIAYEISDAAGPVTFVADPHAGATITANRGTWAGPRLTLTPAEARAFTLTLTERPGVEPAGYWSMNDAYFTARSDPPPGVIGRAFVPGGTGNRREVLDSGIAWSSLQHGGTLMGWVKLDPDAIGTEGSAEAPIFSTGEDANAWRISTPVRDARWHHLTAVVQHGSAILFIDGREQGRIEMGAANPTSTLQIGSAGAKQFFPGLLDEVRIYDRALSAVEIAAIHRREQPVERKTRPAS